MSQRMRDFSPSSVGGCPKEASFMQLNIVISEGCEEALREEEQLLVSRDVLGFTGLCTAPHLQNWSTCWRQLLVVLEALSRAQRKASKSSWSSRDILWGSQSLGGGYWCVLFSALLNHRCLMWITNDRILIQMISYHLKLTENKFPANTSNH